MATLDLELKKENLIRDILNVDSMDLIEKLEKAFNKIKKTETQKAPVDKYFTPEDYAQIDMAREEIKQGKYTKLSTDKDVDDFLNSL
jgi:hypothetical protein